MTKLQAEKLFDKWLDDAEKKGIDKQEYADHCIDMILHEYELWFGKRNNNNISKRLENN
jgi:hypothetical protein